MTSNNKSHHKAQPQTNVSKSRENRGGHPSETHSQETASPDFEEQIEATELFLERNRRNLLIALAALFLLGISVFAYKQYESGQEAEAVDQMFKAEQYFANADYEQALNGDGNYMGFAAIADEYKGTPAANLAKNYAGICSLQMGNYEEAIQYLKSYDANDVITEATSLGNIGDAYSEMKQYDDAVKYYQMAANKNLQNFSPMYLLKMGLVYEAQHQYEKALAVYNDIKENYSTSQQAHTINEYIERATMKL